MSKQKTTKRNLETDEALPDDLGNDLLAQDPGQVGPDSGGQAGDTQGLSRSDAEGGESIEELATEDQAVEASFLDGVREAGDNPERPVHTHERNGTH